MSALSEEARQKELLRLLLAEPDLVALYNRSGEFYHAMNTIVQNASALVAVFAETARKAEQQRKDLLAWIENRPIPSPAELDNWKRELTDR